MSELINKIKTKHEIKGEVQVTKVYPELENLTVTPTKASQSFNHPDSYGYNNVMVKAIDCEPLSVVPQKQDQNFDGMYDKVTVKAIKCNTLDITPKQENQTFDGMYDKVNVDAIVGDTLNVRPTKYSQTHNGLYEKVNVEAIKGDTLNVTPTKESQTYNGLYETVNVEKMNLETLNVKPSKDSQKFNGAYETVNVSGIKLQEKTVTPTLETQLISTDNGYDGLNKVTIEAIQTEILNIVPSKEKQQFNGVFGEVNVEASENIIDEEQLKQEIINVLIEGVTVSTTEPTVKIKYWLQKSKNMFDKNNGIIYGQFIGSDGSIGTDEALFYQETYIPVKPSTSYTISVNATENWNYFRIAEYNINKTFIKRILGDTKGDIKYTFTTSSNCYYVKLSCSIIDLDILQLQEGSTATTYEEYIHPKLYMLNENNEYVVV